MKVKLFLFQVLLASLCATSCVKEPDEAPGKTEPGGTEPTENVDALAFASFTISPEHNPRIYSELKLVADKDNVLAGAVEYYKTDLSKLVVSFTSNAAKVTVNGADQQSGVTPNDFTSAQGVAYRLYTTGGKYKEFHVRLENKHYTGAPVLAISTKGGAPVTSRDDWVEGTVTIDKQSSDVEEYSGAIEIKGRGHNTWSKDKKPYNIKLSAGSKMMGMNKNKRWVLLANASDRTLMRNRVAFEIGKRTSLAWTPDSRYVNVILNGRFVGSYLLAEHIRVDQNRVDITEMPADATTEPDVTGGYLVEIDRYYDDPENVKFRTDGLKLPCQLKTPDEDAINPSQLAYIKKYFDDIETMLYGGETPDPAYADYIDAESFVDWWIVHELTHNTDATLPGSCHMHKDRLGKLFAGPIWDFDLTTFKDNRSFKIMDALWYGKLFEDPAFRELARQRWIELEPGFASIPEFIDAEAAALQPSAEQNWSIWTLDGNYNQDESLAWSAAVDKMKKCYLKRLEWMDGEIRTW